MGRVFAMVSGSMKRQRTDLGISATAASRGLLGRAPRWRLLRIRFAASRGPNGPRSGRQYEAGMTPALPTGCG